MRPSVYPARVVYHENDNTIAEIRAQADREGVTFADVQRRINRIGLRLLKQAA